jgi:hypothetical protein
MSFLFGYDYLSTAEEEEEEEEQSGQGLLNRIAALEERQQLIADRINGTADKPAGIREKKTVTKSSCGTMT